MKLNNYYLQCERIGQEKYQNKNNKYSLNFLKQYHANDVVTDWSYALAEFLVSSLFRAFLFLEILATFTLQMFFSFDRLSIKHGT